MKEERRIDNFIKNKGADAEEIGKSKEENKEFIERKLFGDGKK